MCPNYRSNLVHKIKPLETLTSFSYHARTTSNKDPHRSVQIRFLFKTSWTKILIVWQHYSGIYIFSFFYTQIHRFMGYKMQRAFSMLKTCFSSFFSCRVVRVFLMRSYDNIQIHKWGGVNMVMAGRCAAIMYFCISLILRSFYGGHLLWLTSFISSDSFSPLASSKFSKSWSSFKDKSSSAILIYV